MTKTTDCSFTCHNVLQMCYSLYGIVQVVLVAASKCENVVFLMYEYPHLTACPIIWLYWSAYNQMSLALCCYYRNRNLLRRRRRRENVQALCGLCWFHIFKNVFCFLFSGGCVGHLFESVCEKTFEY